jgi:YaiO family outer membrane protein
VAALSSLVLLATMPAMAQQRVTEPQPNAAIAPPDAETLYREGRDARLAGRMDEAIGKLRAAAAVEPNNADIQVQLGLALAAARRLDEAKQAFGEALRTAPDYDDARLGLARARLWNGELDAAASALAPLLQRRADDPDVLRVEAQIRAAQAEAASRTGARPEPRPTPAAATPRERARNAASARGPRRAAPAGVMAGAQSLRRRGRFAEAEAAYRRALRRAPSDAGILVAIGLVQAFQGERRFADARASFERALALDPDSLDARLGLARIDLYADKLDDAQAGVDHVLERRPDYTDALSLRARIRLARRDARGAEVDFQNLVGRDPRDSDALTGLGDAQRAQYRDAEARGHFLRAAALAPDSQDIAKRLELPVRPRWRIDLDGSYSRLTHNLAPWKEGSIRVGYIIDERTAFTLGAETSHRFRKVDTLLDARIDHRWSRGASAFLRVGATPNADFRPSFLAEAGGAIEIARGSGFLGPTLLTLDLGLAHYRNAGDVKTASPGIVQYSADGRLWFTGKLIGTVAANGDRLFGFSLRADARLTDKFSVFVGYADAPDNSDGRTFPSKAVFGGLAYDATDSVSLKASVARETRSRSYSRTTFSLGLTVRY